MTGPHTYQVNVTREDKWWMITVPELDGYVGADGVLNLSTVTQARQFSDVPREAIDFICTATGHQPSKIAVSIDHG